MASPPSRRCWRRDSGRGRTTTSQRRTPSGTISPGWASCSRTGVRAPAGFGDRVEGLHATAAALATGRLIRLIAERGRADRDPLAGLIAQAHRARAPGGSGRRCPSRSGDRGSSGRGRGGIAHPVPLARGLVASSVTRGSAGSRPHRGSPQPRCRRPFCAGSGIDGLVIPLRRAAPPGPAAMKAAAGALESLPVAAVDSVAEGLELLRRLGVWTLGLDAAGRAQPLRARTADRTGGSGGRGRRQGTRPVGRERCDMVVSIPLDPRVESLNASVAAALACFEIRRARSIVR